MHHDDSSDEEIVTPVRPSAKALGKRKVVEVQPDSEREFLNFRRL